MVRIKMIKILLDIHKIYEIYHNPIQFILNKN
jgi:hypothetical protein